MSLLSAYLLISHGSRDPRPQLAMEKLALLVCDRLRTQDAIRTPKLGTHRLSDRATQGWQPLEANGVAAPTRLAHTAGYPLVGTATLELAEQPLHEQIRQFARVAMASGCNQLQVLPLFLLPGVHVMEDIPQEVALAQQCVGQTVVINQRPHIGTHPDLGKLLASQVATLKADAKIVLGHGSRRLGANEPVEAVAKQLGAVAAYWSVKPTLEEQVEELVRADHKQLAILPYFLFSGGITDAIAQTVAELQQQFPTVQLSLGEPLGATVQVADLLIDLIAR